MNDFIHLHLHTSASQLDGVGTSEDYAKETVRIGQTALSITDHGNIDGILKHQKACAKHNITPVLGCEMYMCQDMKVKDDQRYHLIALVRSREGLTNLMHMISMANLEGFHRRPRIDPDLLLRHTEGLVFLTACIGSFINMPGGEVLLQQLSQCSPTFLEVMPHTHPLQKKHNLKCLALSQKYDIPLVATNDCHYPRKGMGETQDVLLAMKRNAKWNDQDRWSMRDWPNLHLRSEDEMSLAFIEQKVLGNKVWGDAMYRTMEVAELCNGYTVGRVPVELPKAHGYEDRDETDLMWEIISDGWGRRSMTPGREAEYEARVNHEFELICSMNFERYFLIVHELLGWCRSKGIMVGPGRGCFSGDTKISLLDGTEKSLQELTENWNGEPFWVYSCTKEGKIVPGLASNPRITKKASIVCKIKLDNEEEITCTIDHQFMMRDGTYKEARYLKERDSLMPLYRKIDSGGYEWYLNLKMENYSGRGRPKGKRYLKTQYLFFDPILGHDVHHIDFNQRNNSPENLEQIPIPKHRSLHIAFRNKQNYKNPEYRNPMTGKSHSLEAKEKIRQKAIGRIPGEETRVKMSESRTGKKKSEEHKAKQSETMKRLHQEGRYKKVSNHKVVSISFVPSTREMYDIEVEKYHNFALSSGVFVHNSSGGSLICYLMNITDVDPLKYGLIFARFISPERVDYPDIDMDFESARREEVIQHLRDCYGEYNVVNISTFMTMKGKGAIRDVSRVFDVPLKEADQAAKSITDVAKGDDRLGHTIEDSLKENPVLADFQRKWPQVVRHAMDLEGQTKGYGKHAAGMCISATDLRQGEHCSLRVYNGVISANWDKDDAEYMGMMKMDVLGITNLSYLNEAVRLVKELHGETVEFDQLPLDDQEVYNQIAQGNTAGAFQIGSNLNARYCQELGVQEFSDIVLINALTRPGPLGAGVTEQFLRRRRGHEPVSYIHPRMESYTRETLGLVIFQEQVMWTMYELAGLSWGECDKVRKVIGKSKGATAFQQFRQRFVDGCVAQGTLSLNDAGHVWDTLSSFGGYAFVKAHAVEYSLLGYWCMWMRTHWPMEFLCGCLSHCKSDDYPIYVDEARRLDIRIELPKAGVSLADRWLPKDGALWAPLTAIKGIGPSQAVKILASKVKQDSPGKPKKQAQPAFQGFFDKQVEPQPQIQSSPGVTGENSMARLLRRAGYHRDRDLSWEELREADGCYGFSVLVGSERFRCLGDLGDLPERDILGCRLDGRTNLIEIGRYVLPTIDCRGCELINECAAPVQPSFGRYRIMVIGEGPGKIEDQQGMGFVGPAGNDILWPELWKYGLGPTMFHTTNCCKCWPSKTKTPGKRHITACAKWLDMEFKGLSPVMVLAFGGTGVKALRDDQGKISELNGQTEWSDKYQCWISWCLHPASVLHNPGNRSEFERGIENFARKLKAIGGAIWANSSGIRRKGDLPACPYNGDFGAANGNYAECAGCFVWESCAAEKSRSDWLGALSL